MAQPPIAFSRPKQQISPCPTSQTLAAPSVHPSVYLSVCSLARQSRKELVTLTLWAVALARSGHRSRSPRYISSTYVRYRGWHKQVLIQNRRACSPLSIKL